jgi:hypothetical protein
MAYARAVPLALVGPGHGELTGVGYAIHSCVAQPGAPFVLCDPRRRGPLSVRSPYRCVRSGLEALRESEYGSAYFHCYRLPDDWVATLEEWRKLSARTMLIVDVGVPPFLLDVIRIPRLSDADIRRLVDEIADPEDRDVIIEARPSSLPEIEKIAMRLHAIRNNTNLSEAARELNMRGVSLRNYLRRRGLEARVPRRGSARARKRMSTPIDMPHTPPL